MFDKGDIVKIIGTEKLAVIIENEQQTATVDIIFDGEEYIPGFLRTGVEESALEYAVFESDDIRKGYMEYIARSAKLKSIFSGTGRTPDRIPFMLRQVEKVWRKYPEMRLGQLLTACSANKLFYMEDSTLADGIEEFIKR